MKLLRTIRLDPSDTFVFEQAAEPGEWAVSGAFAFWNSDPGTLEGKARTAFRSGFLGLMRLPCSAQPVGAFPPATFTSVTFRHVPPPSSVRYSSLPMMPAASGLIALTSRVAAPGFGF